MDSKLKEFISQNSSDGMNDDLTHTVNAISIGYVVDTDDPLEMGRLRIFCGNLNDNPKKLHHLPWATYSSPYGGSINNSDYARGHLQGQEHTNGAVHYGFWGIPEQGAHVLVACINGDMRRRVWLGCVPEHQETHTLFTGRFDWSGGYPDGPLSSTKSPIEPAYTNASKAFNDDKKSAEWKTRIATYQPMSVREDLGEIPNPSKSSYLDNQFKEISEKEKDDWVKGILGSHGYDWSGYKKLGSFKSSRVFGMSTPGFHALLMDDRPFNSRIQFKTTAGHQILLDDTNERIYISTYEGKSYIEMDKNGNIDMYCDKRLSMHSKQDINIESDETVRIKGKKGIHMYAGDTTGQTPLTEVPPDGQIRLHSTDDMHFYSENNLRQYVTNSSFIEVGENSYNDINGEMTIDAVGTLKINSDDEIGMKSNSSQMIVDGNGITASGDTIQYKADSDLLLSTATSTLDINPTDIILQGANDVFMNSIGNVSSSFNGIISQFNSVQTLFNSAMLEINTIQGAFSTAIDALGGGLIGVPTLNDISGTALGQISGILPIPNLNLPEIISGIIPEINVIETLSETEIAIWPNRIPEHEPWPRVMKQDSDDEINKENNGYLNNVDSIDQYDNTTSPKGREPIGKIEGDETIERNMFWRR